jgi:hypothetical protein
VVVMAVGISMIITVTIVVVGCVLIVVLTR